MAIIVNRCDVFSREIPVSASGVMAVGYTCVSFRCDGCGLHLCRFQVWWLRATPVSASGVMAVGYTCVGFRCDGCGLHLCRLQVWWLWATPVSASGLMAVGYTCVGFRCDGRGLHTLSLHLCRTRQPPPHPLYDKGMTVMNSLYTSHHE